MSFNDFIKNSANNSPENSLRRIADSLEKLISILENNNNKY